MTPERWREIERVYHLLLERAPKQRTTLLRAVCNGDAELRQEVESLLSHEAGAGDFLGAAVLEIAALANDLRGLPVNTAGTHVGNYFLLRNIGEGGMGEVWLAEQNKPVRRCVALKMIKAGMNTREVMARFESERQALALMNHPAIARVFDAGSTPHGTPYFAMEYVSGVPITTYCDNHRLSIRERLDLFIQVCEGVQHAHQKAVIHRDLKPSNILVMQIDGKVTPKIIDFGVAKALNQKLTADTIFTRVGALLGTPQYMSPEQALSSGVDIDTRTDVYSLGTVLYELLAGSPPLDLKEFTLDEFLLKLRNQEPANPSTKIRTYDEVTAAELAQARQTHLPLLVKAVRGDLDSIALKALEKQPSRRYGSPSELAADIQRHLNNEAVVAVPPSTTYRAIKFTRRYRLVLSAVGLVIATLIIAAVFSSWQSIEAAKQRDRADAEAATARAVSDFLRNDLLAQASATNQLGSGAKPDPDMRVRTALDRAAVRIAGKFVRQPAAEATIRDTIGQTYLDLGLYAEARTQLGRSLELHRRTLGTENPQTLRIMSSLGWLSILQENFPEAETLLTQTLRIQRRILGSEHPDTLYSMNLLAAVFHNQFKFAQTEALYKETLEIRRRVLGHEHPDTLTSMNNLANFYVSQGYLAEARYAQAEALYRETLEIRQRVLGSENPATLGSMNNLANIYFLEGLFARAEALHSRALGIQRRVLGAEHINTLWSMRYLALTYEAQGKYSLAEALLNSALETARRVRGPKDLLTLELTDYLANLYAVQGKYLLSEALFRRTLDIERQNRRPGDFNTLWTLSLLGAAYQRQGKFALAQACIEQALVGQAHTLFPHGPNSTADLALAYLSQGKFAESEPLARENFDSYRKNQCDRWERFRAESILGESLAGQGKYVEAEPLLLEGYQGMLARKDRIAVPDWRYLDYARNWIAQLYTERRMPVKAAAFRNPKSSSAK